MKLKTASLLQLKEIQLKKFKIEENIDGLNRFILDADFTPFEITIKNRIYKGIDFTLKINSKAKKPALKAEINMLAIFEIDENLDKRKQIKILLYNGLSILYGIARGMIFQGCSILPSDYRLLPTVNIAEFVKKKMELTSSQLQKET